MFLRILRKSFSKRKSRVAIAIISVIIGAAIATSSLTQADNTLVIQDNADATKELNLELSSIATATTRTLTVPDADGTIALTSDISTSENLTTGSMYIGVGGVETEVAAAAKAMFDYR